VIIHQYIYYLERESTQSTPLLNTHSIAEMDATDRGRSNTAHRNNDRKRSSIQSKRRSTRVMSYVALATYGLMAAAAVGYGGEVRLRTSLMSGSLQM
jgi:hypothetical protein